MNFNKEQWIGIALLIAAIFMFIPIPFMDERMISALIVVIIGFWKLLFK